MIDKHDKKSEALDKNLDEFLTKEEEEAKCVGDECLIKTDKSIVEVIDKKIITEDGRQLLC